MQEMLGHPDWFLAHLIPLVGYIALLVGLIFFRKGTGLPERTLRWARYAIIGTVLQIIEMIFHTAAMVDHGNLVAGQPTPVLTIHLWLIAIFYPLFAISIIGLIIAGIRDHSLGSPWIAWLGILGAASHALAPILVTWLGILGAWILFPMVMLLALWFVLAAIWPTRKPLPASPAV